uniref:Uncharacterized protein n=1 Tax=Anopheles quadriannulatus TaxID=34691 RepID=A0A182XQM2_ANOQN
MEAPRGGGGGACI